MGRDVFPCSSLHTKNLFSPCVIHMHEIIMALPCKYDFIVHHSQTGPEEGTEGLWTRFCGDSPRTQGREEGSQEGLVGHQVQHAGGRQKSDSAPRKHSQ